MPLITRVFLKTGLIYFMGSLLIGILLQIPGLQWAGLLPVFWHMLMLGWITQIILGVSLWMFPGRSKEESFLAQRWAWLSYVLLNTGLGLRLIAEPMVANSPNKFWRVMLVISAVLQFLGVCFYVMEIWPRVLSVKQRIRKRKGEQ